MKFFQAFSSGAQGGLGGDTWSKALLDEFRKSKKLLIRSNLDQQKDFDKLLNLQERLNKDINDLATELPDDFQSLLQAEQDKLQEEVRRNKEAKKESEELKKHMEALAEGDEEALDRINKSLGNLQNSQALARNANIQASISQAQNASSGIDMNAVTSGITGSALQEGLGKMLSDGAGSLLSKMGVGSANPYVAVGEMIFAGVKWGVTESVGQLTDLNDQMIGLERATGGVITANKVQLSVYGSMRDSWKSLKSAAIAANLSVEQITDSLKEFGTMDGGFGLVNARGMSNNKDIQNQMQSFGIESAKIKKLYNTDIIPAVQGMFKNWGVSIQDGSEAMVDGVRQMRLEGLSPEIWTKNMEKLVQLSGKLTFANGAKGMKNIATMATKLGVSVDAIVDGFSQMKGFTDVFERQAEMSALGMNEYGKNLGKIYALRKQGKHDEASSLEIQSVAGDLKSKGLANFQTGEISQQGIEFMDAMGMTQEQIQAMQKATQLASQKMKQLGWSLSDALKPLDKLTESQKKQAEQIEANNKTLKEGMQQFQDAMKDQLIGRLAKLLEPLAESIGSWFGIKSSGEMLRDKRKELGIGNNQLENLAEKAGIQKKESGFFDHGVTGWFRKDGYQVGADAASKYSVEDQQKLNNLIEQLGTKDDAGKKNSLMTEFGYSSEEADKLVLSMKDSTKGLKDMGDAVKSSTDIINKQVQTQEELLKLNYQQKREFVAKNINEALDRAMRDLVTYGKVGKAPKVDALDKQFEQVKTAEANAKVNPTPVNVTVNNNSDMLNTIKVSGVSGSW